MRVSGFETENETWIKEKLSAFFDEVSADGIGNIFAKNKGGSGKKKLLLATNWDESGFIVTKITDDGYLKFESVGRIDAAAMISKKVDINGHTGVISLKAIHLSTAEERKKPVDTEKLFVDIGAENRDEALKIVSEGDYFTFRQEVSDIGEYICGRGVDSAAAMDILIHAAKELESYDTELLFCAEHHVGMRGLRAAADIEADACIVLEGIDIKNRRGKEKEEKGNILCCASKNYTAPKTLFAKAAEAAKSAGIPAALSAVNTEDEAGLLSALGIPVIYIGLSCRCQNTASCMVSKKDIEDAKKLTVKTAEVINEYL